jgi:23S rRNA U2552 (ribose-2'-O)-methylase RlmE/FtsJ
MSLTKNLLKYTFAHSSKAWFKQHVNDEFVKKAAEQNYRSRAAFKLEEIQDKYKVLGEKVIDLGSAPGSWSEFALRFKKSTQAPKINVVSVDILEVLLGKIRDETHRRCGLLQMRCSRS